MNTLGIGFRWVANPVQYQTTTIHDSTTTNGHAKYDCAIDFYGTSICYDAVGVLVVCDTLPVGEFSHSRVTSLHRFL